MQIWGNESDIMSLVAPAGTYSPYRSSHANSPAGSVVNLTLEKKGADGDIEEVNDDYDEESADANESINRRVILTSSIMVGFGLFLMIILILGFGVSTLIYEVLIDGYYMRLALLVFLPASAALSLFFFIVLFGNFFQACGPISSLQTNSRFNSPVRPNLSRAFAKGMTPPPITIQMPVYKEGLNGVIIPTVNSLKDAISYYEKRGGVYSKALKKQR